MGPKDEESSLVHLLELETSVNVRVVKGQGSLERALRLKKLTAVRASSQEDGKVWSKSWSRPWKIQATRE